MKCKKCKESFASNIDSNICSFCRPETTLTDTEKVLEEAREKVRKNIQILQVATE